jgi:NTP pyrophosphatase (non-canonical NTP hydrolase)
MSWCWPVPERYFALLEDDPLVLYAIHDLLEEQGIPSPWLEVARLGVDIVKAGDSYALSGRGKPWEELASLAGELAGITPCLFGSLRFFNRAQAYMALAAAVEVRNGWRKPLGRAVFEPTEASENTEALTDVEVTPERVLDDYPVIYHLGSPSTWRTERLHNEEASMDMREFSRRNRRRCESPSGFDHPLGSWSLSDWMTALAGEMGKAANLVKKLNRAKDGIPGNTQTPEELHTALGKELADTYCYLDLLAQAAGFSLTDLALDRFNEVSRRMGYTEPSP